MTKYTIQDAISKIDKTNHKFKNNIDFEELYSLLNLEFYSYSYDNEIENEFNDLFEAYYVPDATWCCTDTWVGLSVLFFKNEAVAILNQSGRKSDLNINFFNIIKKNEVTRELLNMYEKYQFNNYDKDNSNEFVELSEDVTHWFKNNENKKLRDYID